MEYNFLEIEKKWQAYWAANHTFKTDNKSDKPKYYVLDMFPYPSGAGLHVGHPLGYIASDIYSRYKRLKGFNVLHPMGYDAFGLPAEQYAIQTGQHPEITTEQNIARYRQQMDRIGFSYDWSREVRTCDPAFYKWTQWAFLQMFDHWYDKDSDKAMPIEILVGRFEKEGNAAVNAACGAVDVFTADEWNSFSEDVKSDILMQYRIAYQGETSVNWCPALGTVLANDEVKEGISVRGGFPVEQKRMKQWQLRVSAYAERLLDDMESLDWTESLKEMQRNWNRIWSLCCACGIRLPEVTGRGFLRLVRETLKGLSLDEITAERFEMALADYEKYLERSEKLDGMILEVVRSEDDMVDLMQLPGFYYMSAFAAKTIVEDANRFTKGSKLSAYSGLAPQVNTSGEEEIRAERKGGSGKPLDTEGRRDLKYYYCEAAQTVLNTCGKTTLGKWGWHLIFKGKERNKVVCGVARKLTVYSWHIMRGDPTPNREGEALFRRKMIRFATDIGKNRLRELGYKSRSEFADKHVQRLYGALPKGASENAKH